MTYQEVLENARAKMAPKCMVCKECNGLACRGQIPGPGGKGSGRGFTVCLEYLASVKLRMDVIYESHGQETSIELFGQHFQSPIFAAPIAGMKLNYGGAMAEREYTQAIVQGANAGGGGAFTPDGPTDEIFDGNLEIIRQAGGRAIPTMKPWKNETVLHKLAHAEAAGAMAFAMDVDSAGLINLKLAGKPVSPKSIEELREIVQAAHIPFIIKGVMTGKGAEKAAKAGAAGIVVSSHGGRVLDDTPATCSVLPEIRQAVGDSLKIFVDGGIRTGADVFKAIALGADAACIGRPYAIAAHGGGREGVELYTRKLVDELKDAMLMTGCGSLKDIGRDKIICSK
jgi:4-hydroxymandelate oxidase